MCKTYISRVEVERYRLLSQKLDSGMEIQQKK